MSQEQWTQVDRYLEGTLVRPDSALDAALEASRAAGLPDIQVAPAQGKLLQILARSIGARSILEIGTLGGYSTIWLARALPPGGRVVTLELERAIGFMCFVTVEKRRAIADMLRATYCRV